MPVRTVASSLRPAARRLLHAFPAGEASLVSQVQPVSTGISHIVWSATRQACCPGVNGGAQRLFSSETDPPRSQILRSRSKAARGKSMIPKFWDEMTEDEKAAYMSCPEAREELEKVLWFEEKMPKRKYKAPPIIWEEIDRITQEDIDEFNRTGSLDDCEDFHRELEAARSLWESCKDTDVGRMIESWEKTKYDEVNQLVNHPYHKLRDELHKEAVENRFSAHLRWWK